MAPLLWSMAFLPRNFITTEVLCGEEESDGISELFAWGILKKNGGVFTLTKDEQDRLLRSFDIKKEKSHWCAFSCQASPTTSTGRLTENGCYKTQRILC